MEVTRFLNVLRKHKYTLIGVPFLVVCITFVLVRKLPNSYLSKATISAGLVDQSQQLLVDLASLQESKTDQSFSNLIQMLQMKKVFDQVSYSLILHDLTAKESFRKQSKLIGELNKSAKEHAKSVYADKLSKREGLNLNDPDQKGLNLVIESMGYDLGTLMKTMKMYRVDKSDFIIIEFESESPELSAYVVNTLCKEFVEYYKSITKDNELKSVNYLNNLLAAKKDSLEKRMEGLKKFKIENRVLNLDEQTKSLYTQIADLEKEIQTTSKDIDANSGALRDINDNIVSDINHQDSKLIALNQEISQIKQQIDALNKQYISGGFKNEIKQRIDSLKDLRDLKLAQTADKRFNPSNNSRDLVANQRLNLQVNQELAKNGVTALRREYDKLSKKLDSLVPSEAVIQAYQGDIDLASQEYVEILKKYNQSNLEYNSSFKLKVIEWAMPGYKLPSKKLMLVGLSGFTSLIFCLLVLFVLFYLDDSIKTPDELADKTKLPVLGYLPKLKNIAELDLKELWEGKNEKSELSLYKNNLRSIRYEIDSQQYGPCVINITSPTPDEGKTMLAMSLASAFPQIKKRTLLIDGNFNNPYITEILSPQYCIEDYLTGKATMPTASKDNDVVVLGNYGKDVSLFEINDEATIIQKIQELKKEFDVIIVESSSLDTLNKSKEWSHVADKVVGVFESNRVITNEANHNIEYLRSLEKKYLGWVMNKLSDDDNTDEKKKKSFFRKKPKKKK